MPNQAVHLRLKEIARAKTTTNYSEIAPLANLDMASQDHRERMRLLLYEINRYEHEMGHPLLSAVVIYLDGNSPGHGFFTCARELGVYKGRRSPADEITFWVSELKRVYNFWAKR